MVIVGYVCARTCTFRHTRARTHTHTHSYLSVCGALQAEGRSACPRGTIRYTGAGIVLSPHSEVVVPGKGAHQPVPVQTPRAPGPTLMHAEAGCIEMPRGPFRKWLGRHFFSFSRASVATLLPSCPASVCGSVAACSSAHAWPSGPKEPCEASHRRRALALSAHLG